MLIQTGGDVPDVGLAPADERMLHFVARHFTCIFPTGHEPDHRLVAQIRAFYPPFVPIWMQEHYKFTTGGDLFPGFYVIGRWDSQLEPGKDPLRVERPTGFPFTGGYIYDERTWAYPTTAEGAKLGFPPEYRPFDHQLVGFLDRQHREFNRTPGKPKEKVLRGVRDEFDAEDAAAEAIEAEADGSLRDDARWVVNLMDEGKFFPRAAGPRVQVSVPGAPTGDVA